MYFREGANFFLRSSTLRITQLDNNLVHGRLSTPRLRESTMRDVV